MRILTENAISKSKRSLLNAAGKTPVKAPAAQAAAPSPRKAAASPSSAKSATTDDGKSGKDSETGEAKKKPHKKTAKEGEESITGQFVVRSHVWPREFFWLGHSQVTLRSCRGRTFFDEITGEGKVSAN
ncbi:hypothetical protein AC1031_012240 [Aphanomyces cochlioides]|nr:hypothetical protein AC1031_012240 [Aphanomyces cochlioides]